MKNIPKKIYLQIDDACDTEDFDILTRQGGITWCRDRINKDDIEYILKGEK